MGQEAFLNAMIKLAEKIKGSRLTTEEISSLISAFNTSTKGTTEEKAIDAIQKTVGWHIILEHAQIQKRAAFSTDSIDALLNQVSIEAKKWENENAGN